MEIFCTGTLLICFLHKWFNSTVQQQWLGNCFNLYVNSLYIELNSLYFEVVSLIWKHDIYTIMLYLQGAKLTRQNSASDKNAILLRKVKEMKFKWLLKATQILFTLKQCLNLKTFAVNYFLFPLTFIKIIGHQIAKIYI